MLLIAKHTQSLSDSSLPKYILLKSSAGGICSVGVYFKS